MKTDTQQEVKQIKESISQLTETLDRLNLDLDILERSIEEESHPDSPRFKKGDILRITNSYKGKQGTIGLVISNIKTRCTIIDSYGIKHTCAKTNLETCIFGQMTGTTDSRSGYTADPLSSKISSTSSRYVSFLNSSSRPLGYSIASSHSSRSASHGSK